MGFLEKAARLVAGGGPEAEGLAILREVIAELSKPQLEGWQGPINIHEIAVTHEARVLRLVLGRLKSRGVVGPEAERKALEDIKAFEDSEGGAKPVPGAGRQP